jgi:hypothetical protein
LKREDPVHFPDETQAVLFRPTFWILVILEKLLLIRIIPILLSLLLIMMLLIVLIRYTVELIIFLLMIVVSWWRGLIPLLLMPLRPSVLRWVNHVEA